MHATISTRLSNGEWHHSTVPERTTVRHGLGWIVEVGNRAEDSDTTTVPYSNWGYRDRLDYTLHNA